MARERGLSPWPYVLNYLAIFFVTIFACLYAFISFFGIDGLKDEQGLKTAMMFEPFAIMFEVFLFLYFRKRIQKAFVPSGDNDDDYHRPQPPKEKKDLSYFR
jgi:hypothetical protein